MAQIRSKQIQDFLTTVNWSSVTNKQIANAFDVDARFDLAESSIDSLESIVAAGNGSLVESVDSLEIQLSAEIYDARLYTSDEMQRASEAEGVINNSIDSLEAALAAEISATNTDVTAINSSIDSLETAVANEAAARIAGDTYKEQTVTGIASGKAFVLASGVKFGATNDLEVFVNGLKVAFTTTDGISFEIVSSYELESTDKVTVLGIQA